MMASAAEGMSAAFRGDTAMVTPKKSTHPDQTTPRRSERKRALFPSASPQTSDLGHISPLSSSPDRFSSAPASPESANFSPTKGKKNGEPMSPFGRRSHGSVNAPTRVSPRKRFSELFGLETMLNNKIPSLPETPQSSKPPNARVRRSPRSSEFSQTIVPADQLEQTILSAMDDSDCEGSPHSHTSQRTPGTTPGGMTERKASSEGKPAHPLTPSKRRSLPVSGSGSTTSTSPQSPKQQRRLSLEGRSKSAELPRARTSLFSDANRFSGIKRDRDDGIYLTGRSTKRRKTFGGINAGVRTGIRRPPKNKPKKKTSSSKFTGKVKSVWDVGPKSGPKKKCSPIKLPAVPKMSLVPKPAKLSPEEQAAFSASASIRVRAKSSNDPEEEEEEEPYQASPVPKVKSNKKPTKEATLATVTVNKHVRIHVTKDGKFTLARSETSPPVKRKRKLFNQAEQIEAINMFDDKQEDVADSTRGDVQNILEKLEDEKGDSPIKTQMQPVASGNKVLEPESIPRTVCLTPSKSPTKKLTKSSETGNLNMSSPSRTGADAAPQVTAGLLSPLSELASSTSTLSLNIGGDTLCLNSAHVQALSAVPDIIMEDDDMPMYEAETEATEAVPLDNAVPPSIDASKENESCLANAQHPSLDKLFPIFNRNTQKADAPDLSESTRKRKRPMWRPIGEDQYQIDAGQKRFGATQCGECDLVYQLGDPEDENSHNEYHRSARVLKHLGWKKERVIGMFGGNRVIVVKPGDPKPWWDKVKDVLEVVDRDLGFVGGAAINPDMTKVLMYISDRRIVGCIVAEPRKTAFRMLISGSETGGVDCCSTEEYPVRCGISRIWVHSLSRRQHIASELMDCMRKNFLYGYILSIDDLAFSSPTTSGKIFAECYTARKDYFVYT